MKLGTKQVIYLSEPVLSRERSCQVEDPRRIIWIISCEVSVIKFYNTHFGPVQTFRHDCKVKSSKYDYILTLCIIILWEDQYKRWEIIKVAEILAQKNIGKAHWFVPSRPQIAYNSANEAASFNQNLFFEMPFILWACWNKNYPLKRFGKKIFSAHLNGTGPILPSN